MSNERKVWTDQDDTLLVGNVAHPHPGHLTEYERIKPRKPRKVNWFVLVLCAVILTWFVVRAVLLSRGL